MVCCGLIELQDWLLVHEIKATLDAAPQLDWIKTTNHVGETYWFNKASGQTSIASPLSKRLQSMVDHHRKLGGKLISDSFNSRSYSDGTSAQQTQPRATIHGYFFGTSKVTIFFIPWKPKASTTKLNSQYCLQSSKTQKMDHCSKKINWRKWRKLKKKTEKYCC
jgi:hypothetical protein